MSAPYIIENLNDMIRRHRDVVNGHDAVHPDRGDCGGVGGCALMLAEHKAETDVIDQLEHAARAGLTLTAHPAGAKP